MKGFVKVIRWDNKKSEYINISHIGIVGENCIVTDIDDWRCGKPYICHTAHTHEELVEIINKAIEESEQ